MCFSGLQVLRKIRGADSVDERLQNELDDIQKAVVQTQNEQTSVFSGLSALFHHYPQILFAAVIIPIAQQFTGMNAIMFVSLFPPSVQQPWLGHRRPWHQVQSDVCLRARC